MGYTTLDSTGYDANGNRIYNLSKNWDKTDKKWVKENEAEFVYDVNDNTARLDIYYLGEFHRLMIVQ